MAEDETAVAVLTAVPRIGFGSSELAKFVENRLLKLPTQLLEIPDGPKGIHLLQPLVDSLSVEPLSALNALAV